MTSNTDPLGIEVALRDVTSNDILFLGCSYTVGHGLLDTTKKYSSLFSSHYNKQEINLAKSGTGNYLDDVLETYLNKFPEYVFLDGRLGTESSYRVDNAADGTAELGTGHPGPGSNQIIAEKLINHFNKLYS